MVKKIYLFQIASILFFSCASNVGSDVKEKANLYFNLGNSYSELEQYDKAVEAYANAWSLDSSFTAAGYNLIRVYIYLKKYDEAEGLLKELLSRDDRNLLLMETAGYLYHHKGDYGEALRYYNRVLAGDSLNKNALYNTYLIYKNQENAETAMKQLQIYIDNNPNDSNSLYQLANLYEELNDEEKAIEQYAKFLEVEKKDKEKIAEVKNHLVDVYLKKELYSEALKNIDTLIDKENPDPNMLFNKAWALLIGKEEYKEGIKILKEAIEAGFQNKKRATQMGMKEDALYHDEIVKFLKDQQLYDPNSLK